MIKTVLCVLLVFTLTAVSSQTAKVEVLISVADSLKPSWKENGRLTVFFSKDGGRQPAFQSTFSPGRNAFARNISGWTVFNKTEITGKNSFSAANFTLNNVPLEKWFVQAVYNVSEKPIIRQAGNFFSVVVETTISENMVLELELSQIVESGRNEKPADTEWVKYIDLESKLLSGFWQKPMNIQASVLLPRNFKKGNPKKYPLRINIGGYGSSWTRASRLERNKEFMKWWQSDNAPEIIQVFLNGADGPFGDPYYVDSKNNGPYGSALTKELIPFIEKEFNGIGESKFRFLDGCSTGGWVSLALQIFYPDFFNGAWSFSADPVDFHHMQLVNMYEDKNAFFNQFGYLTPSVRSKTGQPSLSIKDEVAGENLVSFENSYITSGGQWGGWNAVYSPRGKDGLPVAAFHPVTGEIDSVAVKNWEKYDLLKILDDNWEDLGPKLQGKLWIWMGDMDQFYLNNAMREMEKFLISAEKPKSDAAIIFEPMKGHCESFEHKWVLEMMQKKVEELQKENDTFN